jgi:tartrate dehydratase beta subunit/fumarate hydratase class I family protein
VTVMGTIVKIKGLILTIRDFQDRGQTIVQIDRNTKFVSKGMGRKNSVRDLKVGDFVQVTGTRNKDRNHSIQAKLIVVSKTPSRSHS